MRAHEGAGAGAWRTNASWLHDFLRRACSIVQKGSEEHLSDTPAEFVPPDRDVPTPNNDS